MKSPAKKPTASPVATRTLKAAPSSSTPPPTRAIVKSTKSTKSTKPATPAPAPTLTAKPTPKATATTPKPTPTAAKTPANQVSLCVQVTPAQASSDRGQPAQWTVSAWTTGGNVADAVLRLQSAPASGGAPGFSFGCGKDDGTSSCDLGAVDAKSAPRQLQARLTVPVSASAVKSVSLTVTGSTAHLAKDSKAAAAVAITPPPTATGAGAGQVPADEFPITIVSPLPVGSLPGIPAASPTLSPGGNASSLFPTINPRPSASPGQPVPKARTRPVANTSALPEGAPVVGAQIAGLAALALAFVLAVTRLSIRRRPASPPRQDKTPTPQTPEAGQDPPAQGGEE